MLRTPADLQRRLLEAIDRTDGEVFRKDYGTYVPSPGKLIREGLAIAKRCVRDVPLTEPDYLGAVMAALKSARDAQDTCGVSDDGWRDDDGYILAGIGDAYRDADRLLRQGPVERSQRSVR